MSDVVRAMQGALKALGHYAGNLDGAWGPMTDAALQRAFDARDVAALQRLGEIFGGALAGDVPKPASGPVQAPVRPPAAYAPWMTVARGYMGQKEIPGPAANPKIVALFAMCGHAWVKDDETAWCAAFVGGVLAQAGIVGTKSLAARSYEKWGQALPMNAPILGCVGVKERDGGAAWQGHTGFVVGASAATIFMLSGNASNMVNIAGYRRSEFTAFRWPPGMAIPGNPPRLPTSIEGASGAVSEA